MGCAASAPPQEHAVTLGELLALLARSGFFEGRAVGPLVAAALPPALRGLPLRAVEAAPGIVAFEAPADARLADWARASGFAVAEASGLTRVVAAPDAAAVVGTLSNLWCRGAPLPPHRDAVKAPDASHRPADAAMQAC